MAGLLAGAAPALGVPRVAAWAEADGAHKGISGSPWSYVAAVSLRRHIPCPGDAQEARASWLDAREGLLGLALQAQKMQVQPTAMVSMTVWYFL